MTINIEELRKDIEAGTQGDWWADPQTCEVITTGQRRRDVVVDVECPDDQRRIARLPELEREYIALREAADALASQAGDVINSADEIGDYVDPMISMPLSVVSDLGREIKAYRKATQ